MEIHVAPNHITKSIIKSLKEFNLRKFKFSSLSFVILLTFTTSGCFLNTFVTSTAPAPVPDLNPVINKISVTDFVAASGQLKKTVQRQYIVSASVGGFTSTIVSTSARGYRMHSSVQGI